MIPKIMFQLGTLLSITTPTPPTTVSPSENPPFEASNLLVNQTPTKTEPANVRKQIFILN